MRLIFNLFKFKILEKIYSFQEIKNDELNEIDIIIPTITKDFDSLLKVVTSTRYIAQRINKIYIISNSNNKIINFCLKNNLVFIDEKSIFNFDKNHIKYKVGDIDRSGWLFQQLIKLNGDKITEKENFLVLDSDTIFIRRITFFKDNKTIFYYGKEWHWPYHQTNKKLINYKIVKYYSFVNHLMMFNKIKLLKLKSEIERKTKCKWYDAIIQEAKKTKEISFFSEFELYSQWFLNHYKNESLIKPLFNSKVTFDNINKIDISKKHTISYHSYQ